MARNEEKAQSMLYRFREAKAAELGLAQKTDRRPRIASTCKDLRQCERWRGEILREISRKVSKIQDFGLTDYEIRDLNDEINKLLREKRHWENQILALGGANYKRVGKMLDEDGKEVPGTYGYKYFGRAKELPGVKELFQSTATEESEISDAKNRNGEMFRNLGPDYFGDLDEQDGKVLEYETKREQQEWRHAWENVAQRLDLDEEEEMPLLPKAHAVSFIPLSQAQEADDTTGDFADPVDRKRKAPEDEGASRGAKKSKQDAPDKGATMISVLKEEDIRPPKTLSAADVEAVLVARQKAALLADYLG